MTYARPQTLLRFAKLSVGCVDSAGRELRACALLDPPLLIILVLLSPCILASQELATYARTTGLTSRMNSKLELRLEAAAKDSTAELPTYPDADAFAPADKPLTPPATPSAHDTHVLEYSYPPASTSTLPMTPATSPVTSRPTLAPGATFVRQLPPFKIPNFPRHASFATFADSVPPTPGTPGTPGPFSPSIRRALLTENPLSAATSIAVLPPTDQGYAYVYLAATC